MDIRAFIQTSTAATAAADATLRLHQHQGGEQLQAGPVSLVGKIATVLRSIFHITSDAERQATQAFVAAIRQDYGSSGTEALRRLHISTDKPLQVRQVRELAQTLQDNKASDDLKPFRTLGQSHIVDQANDIWRWDRFTDLRRVITHSLADMGREAESIVDAAVTRGAKSAEGRPELAFFVAIAAGDADRLWALPGVREDFERRLDITGALPESPTPVRAYIVRRDNDPDDASAAAATVLADMFRDRTQALRDSGVRLEGF